MTRMLIDLSHTIEHGMQTHPGLPGPVVADFLTREASRERYGGKAEFHIGRIEMVANTGTYLDAPSHRFAGEIDIAALPLERLADLDGVVVTVGAERRAVEVSHFDGVDVRGRAVLIRTGWSRHWRSETYGAAAAHPFVTADAAAHLAAAGAALVGIDSVNIDDLGDPARPAHTTLLRRGIPIVEHLTNLEALGSARFRFFAVPAPVVGLGTFSVRAFAIVEA